MVQNRSAITIAEQYVSSHGNKSQPSALWGARALRRLVPARTAEALALATRMDFPDISIQGCVDVLESLKNGDFGPCEKETELYIEACRTKFSYAIAFKPPAPEQEPIDNHIIDETSADMKKLDISN